MLMFGLTVRDTTIIWNVVPTYLLLTVIATGIIYQMTLMFSVLYHVLLCRSEKDQRFFLILDLFGVFICTLVSFLLSMFYGFICYQVNQLIFFFLIYCTQSRLKFA
ncbi:Progestin and adipoQ receptor family member 3 [Blattella germanica]|nr:Progestin and adipoQ receptor family member 3 [Blattella germanica]